MPGYVQPARPLHAAHACPDTPPGAGAGDQSGHPLVRALAYETAGAVQTGRLSYLGSGGAVIAGQSTPRQRNRITGRAITKRD